MPKRTDAFLQYREVIPEEVRQDIKDKLLQAKMEGYETFIATTQYILAEMVGGNIPPEIAKECRAYLELLMTAVAAKTIVEHGKKGTAAELHKSIQEAQRTAKKATRAITEITDFGDGASALDLNIEHGGRPTVLNARWEERDETQE